MSGRRVILIMASGLLLIVLIAIIAATCLETPPLREDASSFGHDPPDTLAGLRVPLPEQEQRYSTFRPHQALGHKTPQKWLLASRKGGSVRHAQDEYTGLPVDSATSTIAAPYEA
jgi:hypothetical protein